MLKNLFKRKPNALFPSRELLLYMIPEGEMGIDRGMIHDRLPGRVKLISVLLPKNSIGVEIGVWKGVFSKKILLGSQPSLLHLVDPWIADPSFPGKQQGDISQDGMDDIFNNVQKEMAGEKARIWRMKSNDFFNSFAAKVDWVYIDGDHRYEPVRQDLDGANSIIKDGGIIWGDDFSWTRPEHQVFYPVKKAVLEFCEENKRKYIAMDDQYIIL